MPVLNSEYGSYFVISEPDPDPKYRVPSNYADLDQDPQKSKLFEKEQIIRVPILSLYKSRLHDFL